MRHLRSLAVPCALLASLFACGGTSGGGGPCDEDMPPPECGQQCDPQAADDCGPGFYCTEGGTCTADCQPGDGTCGDGKECNNHGKCVADDMCGDIDVNLTPVVPIVVLLIDQSWSMTHDFGGGRTRWQAVRYALSDPQVGVLPKLDQQIEVGATLYTSENGNDGPTCPELTSIDPSVGNAQAIGDLIKNNPPVNDTPTAESVTSVTSTFPSDGDRPRVLVLATDGDPDSCANPDANGQQAPRTASENAVGAAWDAGITTYVLSVGTEATATHLQHLANLGQGMPASGGSATPYVANSPDELVAAFGDIIGGIRSCTIDVNGHVDLDQAPDGTVVLNGNQLDYGTDWKMVDDNTLRLLGAACDEYLSSDPVMLSASFPCGGVEVE